MKRRLLVLLVLGAVIVAALSATSAADAAVKWPARCTTFKCVNAHLNAMHATDLAQNTRIANLAWVNQCVNLDAVAQFPGYVYDNDDGTGQFLTTGLDFSAGSGVVDEWILEINAGDCGTPTSARVGARPFTVAGHTLTATNTLSHHK